MRIDTNKLPDKEPWLPGRRECRNWWGALSKCWWCSGDAVGAEVGVPDGVTVVVAWSSSMSTTPESLATITRFPDIRMEVTPPTLALSSYTHCSKIHMYLKKHTKKNASKASVTWHNFAHCYLLQQVPVIWQLQQLSWSHKTISLAATCSSELTTHLAVPCFCLQCRHVMGQVPDSKQINQVCMCQNGQRNVGRTWDFTKKSGYGSR